MAISEQTFLLLEQSLAGKVERSLENEIGADIRAGISAIGRGDLAAAQDIFDEIIQWFHLEKFVALNTPAFNTTAKSAQVFGASRIAPKITVSALMDEGATVAMQAATDSALQALSQSVGTVLDKKFKAMVSGAQNNVKGTLKEFASFAVPDIKHALQRTTLVASSLHTSRMATHGFFLEAQARNVTKYKINEQLDNRICPLCRHMHGRIFRVDEGVQRLSTIMLVDNDADLKGSAPFFKQTPTNMASLRKASAEELGGMGLRFPPYHPLCRGFLVTSTASIPTMPAVVDDLLKKKNPTLYKDPPATMSADSAPAPAMDATPPIRRDPVVYTLDTLRPQEIRPEWLKAEGIYTDDMIDEALQEGYSVSQVDSAVYARTPLKELRNFLPDRRVGGVPLPETTADLGDPLPARFNTKTVVSYRREEKSAAGIRAEFSVTTTTDRLLRGVGDDLVKIDIPDTDKILLNLYSKTMYRDVNNMMRNPKPAASAIAEKLDLTVASSELSTYETFGDLTVGDAASALAGSFEKTVVKLDDIKLPPNITPLLDEQGGRILTRTYTRDGDFDTMMQEVLASEVYSEGGYMSTSLDPNLSFAKISKDDLGEKVGFRLSISGVEEGAYIAPWADIALEQEVVLPPKSKFQILGVLFDKDTGTISMRVHYIGA